MDFIFNREYKNFLTTLRSYINQESTYQELLSANYRIMACNTTGLDFMREFIHNFKLKEYKQAMDYEKKLNELKDENNNYLSAAQGLYQGCAKKDDTTYHLPPYPMMNMLEFQNEMEGVNSDERNDFSFEF